MIKETKFKQTEIGLIPEEWEEKRLDGDLIKINNNSISTKTDIKTLNYYDTSSVYKGKFSTPVKYLIEEAPSRAKRIAKKEDILISTVRPNQEHYAYIRDVKKEDIFSTGFVIIESININSKFLYFYLTSKETVNRLHQIAESHTSTYPSFKPSDISKIKIPYPPLQEQSAIAKILSDLDSKIELLQKQNKTLEKIGQAIFKQWFVDFEFPNEEGKPYKSSGGRMVESELGEIPKDWSVRKFRKIMNIKGRIGWKGYTSEDLVDSGPWVIGGKELNSGYIDFLNCKHISQFKYDESPEIKLNDKDIILAKTGTIGPVAMYRGYMGEATINPNVGIIRALGVSPEYLLYLLKESRVQHYLKEFATASVQPAINQETIKNMDVVIPDNNLQKKYESLILSITDNAQNNVKQILSLQKTRDLLLPKLMTGKIRVPLEVKKC